MLKKLLPILLILIAGAAGAIGGHTLRPDMKDDHSSNNASDEHTSDAHESDEHPPAKDSTTHSSDSSHGTSNEGSGAPAFFRFPTQFFVPVMRGDHLDSVMVLSVSIETDEQNLEAIFAQEHRLRDGMLRSLLVYANTGGFDGNFTTEARMTRLRRTLEEAAKSLAGDIAHGVLIEDIARQDQS